jgi:hypothetical protein
MSQELGSVNLQSVTRIADGALREGRAVKHTTVLNTVEECDAAGERIDGVAMYDAATGRSCNIIQEGTFDRAIAGAALATLHTELAVDAEGRFVAAVTGDIVVGKNLTAAGAAGDYFVLDLDRAERVVPA